MYIKFVEVSNFRKLLSVHVDLTETTTLFVGANNSGKTSAMEALRYFLVESRFSTNDFTLSHWDKINTIGKIWEALGDTDQVEATATLTDWESLLPTLDLWFHVENDEIHYVSRLLPTLDWEGGLLGVRLRYEPTDVSKLAVDYIANYLEAKATKTEAQELANGEDCDVKLWPQTLLEYLDRRINTRFQIRAYSLDPVKLTNPENGIAKPQPLPIGSEPIEDNPLADLILVNEINAQRGLGYSNEGGASSQAPRRLADQAKVYYTNHLDPTDRPQASDLVALRAIEKAEELFDSTLSSSFSSALEEFEELGYPGVTNPQIKISARIKLTDGLNHDAAVQYEVDAMAGKGETTTKLRLPEHYNGLGYQNLILMMFRLMGFRDGRMRVGKMGRSASAVVREKPIPPLHLVLIEEPEAHLHAQVQQIFTRKAYNILRKHKYLGENKALRTQLVVSTHSSHVAHETKFSCLRYFRRLPASQAGAVPVSTVINLSDVFGLDKETERFDTRYLRATHCDLFFADAAILVEGSAERILVPHFIRSHFNYLTQCYISLLEIGGSHAHKLKPLIEKLGLLTLVVTDLDANNTNGGHAQPTRGASQITGNATLKEWLPQKTLIDDLLDLQDAKKITVYDQVFAVRVAYQCPVNVKFNEKLVEFLPSTFEDALAFENLSTFKVLTGATGLMKKFQKAILNDKTADTLSKTLYDSLHTNVRKAEFALDLLQLNDPEKLEVPKYLREGLAWLQEQLKRKHVEVLLISTPDSTGSEQVAS